MNVKLADRVRFAVTAVAGLVMVYAMVVSATHITHVGHAIGLPAFEAATLFVLVDIPAVLGKVLRSKVFAASTRRTGFRLMAGSGLLSLTCNVASGWLTGGVGPATYGVFIVLTFLTLENVVTKIKPAAAVTRTRNVTPTSKATAPARKGKSTTRKPRVPSVAQLEKTYALASAPVSPAP